MGGSVFKGVVFCVEQRSSLCFIDMNDLIGWSIIARVTSVEMTSGKECLLGTRSDVMVSGSIKLGEG